MPKSNKRKPVWERRDKVGYKRTKNGVDMVFHDSGFIAPEDMSLELMKTGGLTAVDGLRDALYDMTDPRVPREMRQEINELIKFTLSYIDGVRMNLEAVKFPGEAAVIKFEDGEIKVEE